MKSKREILLFSLFMLCIVAFVAGGKKTDENKPSDDLVIEALVGIGPIKFGMSKDEITKYLGRPDKILGQGTELNYVSSRGLSFTVDAKSGMQTIKCWSDNWPTKLPFSVKTFTGKTKENIEWELPERKLLLLMVHRIEQIRKELLKTSITTS